MHSQEYCMLTMKKFLSQINFLKQTENMFWYHISQQQVFCLIWRYTLDFIHLQQSYNKGDEKSLENQSKCNSPYSLASIV